MVIAQHLDEMRRQNKRPSTIAQRRRALGRLGRHLGHDDLLTVEYHELRDFVFDRGLAPESEATEISHLRGFYQWAVDVELLQINPAARLRRPAIPHRHPKPMARGDLAVALDLAPPRIRPWLLLATYAGLRCYEISQLRAEDLWFDHDPPLIVINDSKGGDTTSVAAQHLLVDELSRCGLPRRGWLFPRLDGRPGPIPPHRVSQLANRYLHSLGIDDTIHQMRHWFGTETLRAANGNVRVAQEALRHRSITSTQRYTYVAPNEVAAAVNKLPRLTTHPRLPFD